MMKNKWCLCGAQGALALGLEKAVTSCLEGTRNFIFTRMDVR